MHVHAEQAQIFHPRGAIIKRANFLKGDAEFIFVRARGDLVVGVRCDIGIHANGDGRRLFFLARDLVDELQFRDAFHIKRIDAGRQRLLDFGAGLADAREIALGRLAAGLQHARQFPAADQVESAAALRQQVENGQVRVGLHRVANEVIERRQRRGQSVKMISNRCRRIKRKAAWHKHPPAWKAEPLPRQSSPLLI